MENLGGRKIFLFLNNGFFNRVFPLMCLQNYSEHENLSIMYYWVEKIGRRNIKSDINSEKNLKEIFQNFPNIKEITREEYKQERAIRFTNIKENTGDTYVLPFHQIIDLKRDYIPNIKGFFDLKNINKPIFHELRKLIKKLKFPEEIKKKTEEFNLEGYIGIHVRCTDGFFRKKNFKKLEKIIENNKKIFLCSDSKDIINKYRGKIKFYDEDLKYKNNDIGTYYSLADCILLSKCSEIYITNGSSFGFFSFLLSGKEYFDYIDD